MQIKTQTTRMTVTALLMAIAILLPIVMPVKIVIGPTSFTLASHVPIFLAMFFSPSMAVIVALGATAGFFLAGFPILVVLRALSHVLFAYIGAQFLKAKDPLGEMGASFVKSQLFSLAVGVIHAIGETAIVSIFFFGGLGVETTQGFFYTVFLLVGVGTLIHSMVDFLIAQYLWNTQKNRLLDLKVNMT